MALPAVFTKLIALLYYTFNPIWVKAGRFLGGPLIQITYLILKREYLRETCVSSVQLPQESDIKERATPSGTRTFEGSLNNKDRPTMAMTGCPFARNTKPLPTPVNGPDAVTVSQEILARPQGVTKTRVSIHLQYCTSHLGFGTSTKRCVCTDLLSNAQDADLSMLLLPCALAYSPWSTFLEVTWFHNTSNIPVSIRTRDTMGYGPLPPCCWPT